MASVHTIGISVASSQKGSCSPAVAVPTKGKSKPSEKSIEDKYKRLVSRKYFTTVMALKLSAYEKQLMDDGKPVGKWVTSCAHDVKNAICDGEKTLDKTITYRDGSKEDYTLQLRKYGMIDDNGELIIHPHQKRWIRMFNCGSKIQKLTNADGQVFYADKNHDCDDRMCMRCNRKKSWIDFIRYKDALMTELDNPVMLTLHQRSRSVDKFADALNQMKRDWRKIMQQNSKDSIKGKEDKYNLYWTMEVTINPKSATLHPHYHIIIDSSQAPRLLRSWIALDPDNREYYAHGYHSDKLDPVQGKKQAIGDPITSEAEFMEVCKYAFKISSDELDKNGNPVKDAQGKKKTTLAPILMIYEMLMVMYKVHRNGAVGSIYNHRLTKEASKQIIIDQALQKMKEEGFNEDDNPLVDLCEEWVYDYKETDYIGSSDGVTMHLSNYKPTSRTKEYLRINDD